MSGDVNFFIDNPGRVLDYCRQAIKNTKLKGTICENDLFNDAFIECTENKTTSSFEEIKKSIARSLNKEVNNVTSNITDKNQSDFLFDTTCIKCKQTKSSLEFRVRKRDHRVFVETICKACEVARMMAWQSENREKMKAHFKKWEEKAKAELSDSYIKRILRSSKHEGEITKEKIVSKRLELINKSSTLASDI